MSTNIEKSLKEKAFQLYLEGVNMIEIARRFNKNKNTVSNWKKRYKWKEKEEELQKEAIKRAGDTKQEATERLLKMSRAIQAKFAKSIQDQDIKAIDAIRAMEFESKIRGIEVLKIDTNIKMQEPATINIIKPNEKDKLPTNK